jgi:hypothetical protein
VDEVAENASVGAGSNFMVLKCPILHAQPSPLLPTSAALLSESTPRLIRQGITLIGIDVSDSSITSKEENSHYMDAIKYHGLVRFHK